MRLCKNTGCRLYSGRVQGLEIGLKTTNPTTQVPGRRRPDVWYVLTWVVLLGYAAVGFLVLDVAILNHAGGLCSSIMDAVDALGLTDIWELQANLRESRVYMQMMMWGFYPTDGLFSLVFGDSWTALYLNLAYSIVTIIVSGWVIRRYSMDLLDDSRTSFLLVVLFLLLPAVFANTIYWYGQPVFVMLMGALYLMRRGRNWLALPLVIWALGCHPMTVPVFFGMALVAFRLPLVRGLEPLLPGLDSRDAQAARSWRFALILTILMTLWTGFLVVMSRLGQTSGTRGLLWAFFAGKVDSGSIPINVIQVFFFFLPVLFIPLLNLSWLPAMAAILGYMLLGSQGVVTGFSLPAAGFTMVAMAHGIRRWTASTRWKVVLAGIVVAVGVNLLVPWVNLFPMAVEPLTGGLFSQHSWNVQAEEASINNLVTRNIPAGTGHCLTTWQIGPVMASRCEKVMTLSFPFRRDKYELQDFLDTGDRGRIDSCFWDFVLVDLRRERKTEGIDRLTSRIEAAGCWDVAGRTGEAVLYRSRRATGVNAGSSPR